MSNKVAKPAKGAVLLEMTDGTDIIRAHPDQVPLWQQQGWMLTENNTK